MVARFNNSGSMKRQKASHNKLGMKLARKAKGRTQRKVQHNEARFSGKAAREGTIGQRVVAPKEDTMEVVPAPAAAPAADAPKAKGGATKGSKKK